MQSDLFISLLVGFFDGDGMRRKQGDGCIRIHSSWLETLTTMTDLLYALEPKGSAPYINTRGDVGWCINRGVINFLKLEAKRMNLPILERKWW